MDQSLSTTRRRDRLRRLRPAPADPGPVLVLLPHAGGASHAFVPWARVIAEGVDVLGMEYPGHGMRISEARLRHHGALVDEVTNAVLASVRERSPLFLGGHSLGGSVAFEVAHRLEGQGREVSGLFVSAAVPPGAQAVARGRAGALTDGELAAQLVAAGELPAEFLDDPEALDLCLPVIQDDLAMSSDYLATPPPDRPPLRTRAVIVGGEDDDRVPSAALTWWLPLIEGPVEVTVLPGGHFYHLDQLPTVGGLITGLIDDVGVAGPGPQSPRTPGGLR